MCRSTEQVNRNCSISNALYGDENDGEKKKLRLKQMVGRRTFFFTDSYRIVGKSTPLTHTSLQRTHSFKINKFNSVLKLKLTWLRKYRHHANEEKEENKIHWILANGATTHYSHNTCQTRDNSFFFSPLIVWTIQLGFSPRVGLCFECHLFAIRLSVFGIHGNFVEKKRSKPNLRAHHLTILMCLLH